MTSCVAVTGHCEDSLEKWRTSVCFTGSRSLEENEIWLRHCGKYVFALPASPKQRKVYNKRMFTEVGPMG